MYFFEVAMNIKPLFIIYQKFISEEKGYYENGKLVRNKNYYAIFFQVI